MKIKDLFDCEAERHIKKITSEFDKASNIEIIPEEINASDYDLESSKRDFGLEDYKWATIKAYYSILHATKAFIRLKGVIINHHYCTYLYLEKLSRNGEIEARFVYAFGAALDNRMDADYGLKYSKEIANDAINAAEDFNKMIKALK